MRTLQMIVGLITILCQLTLAFALPLVGTFGEQSLPQPAAAKGEYVKPDQQQAQSPYTDIIYMFSREKNENVNERGHCDFVNEKLFNKNKQKNILDAKCFQLTKTNDKVCVWSMNEKYDDCTIAKTQCQLLNGNFYPAPYCSPAQIKKENEDARPKGLPQQVW